MPLLAKLGVEYGVTTMNDEHKNKISEALKGENHYRWTGRWKNKREWQTERNMKKRGLDENQFNGILVKQNYVCAICLKAETRKYKNGTIARLSIDHNHRTGKIRGLLCSKCNFAIGQLDDNPYLCEKAAKYLLTY